MPIRITQGLVSWTAVFTLITCSVVVGVFSGYYHSAAKFKTMLTVTVLIFLFHYLIGDPIKFLIQTMDKCLFTTQDQKFATDNEAAHQSRLDYLMLRLKSLRAHLYITEKDRLERLNCKYKQIIQDIWLYGKYFIFVLGLVLIASDDNVYYMAHNIDRLLNKNHSSYRGFHETYDIENAYKFIESSLINAFYLESGQIKQNRWVHADQTRLLGVIKLRQLRLTEQHYGLHELPLFSKEDYEPGWKESFKNIPYSSYYWRIYNPFLHKETDVFYNFHDHGYIRSYPEGQGYEVLLCRDRQNSLRVLQYLQENDWLNYNTSVLFIDFSFYSMDTNIINICSLRLEQTPMGTVLPYTRIVGVKLIDSLDHLSQTTLLIILLYIIVFVQFFKSISLKLWHEPSELRKYWNKLDVLIFIINIVVIISVCISESKMRSILSRIQRASKMEFIELRSVARSRYIIKLLIGALICLTTLRLWKVLQFSTSFQLFTHTLYLAWKAVATTAIVVLIFMVGFAKAASIINGNYTYNFYLMDRSIVTSMLYALGFSEGVYTEDFNYGGRILGFILYVILVFVINVLLINLCVSLINDYFTTAKEQRDTRAVRRISICHFLRAEYSGYYRRLQKYRIFRKYYKRRNRTVSENIKSELEMLENNKHRADRSKSFFEQSKIMQSQIELENEDFRFHQERVYTIAAIMNTQTDILRQLLKNN